MLGNMNFFNILLLLLLFLTWYFPYDRVVSLGDSSSSLCSSSSSSCFTVNCSKLEVWALIISMRVSPIFIASVGGNDLFVGGRAILKEGLEKYLLKAPSFSLFLRLMRSFDIFPMILYKFSISIVLVFLI